MQKFELNNESIAPNILYVPHYAEGKKHAYKSKYNTDRENQVIILMITNGKKWHFLPVKRMSPLLREITSNHKKDFYCLNCFHSYTRKNKLEKHYEVCKNHDYCYVEMPNENNKILKCNYG